VAKAPVGPTAGRRQAGKPAVAQASVQAAHGPRALPNALVLPLDQLVPDPDQPRRMFDAASLDELRDSIAQQGILQPLLVREDGYVDDGRARYVIVAGERRWRAAQAAGLDAAPVVVRGPDAASDLQELRVLQLIENLQRADLSDLEEARALQELKGVRDLSVRDLAALVSRPATYVQNRLALAALARDEAVARAVEGGQLTPSAAVEIQALPEVKRENVLSRVRNDPTYAPDVAALRRLKQRRSAAPPSLPDPLPRRAVDDLPPPEAPLPPMLAVPNRNTPDADVHYQRALGRVDGPALEVVLLHGIARGWSCQELLRAIQARRSGATAKHEGA